MTALLVLAWLAASPIPKADPTKDRDGHPLPAGATARLGTLTLRGPVTLGVTFAADGKSLLAADGTHIYSWDATTGRRLAARSAPRDDSDARNPEARVFGPRLIRFGKADWNRGTADVLVYRVADGQRVVRFAVDGRPAFDIQPLQMWTTAVSPEGLYLAQMSATNDAVTVYDLGTGKAVYTKHLARGMPRVEVSADGKTLYVSEWPKVNVRRFELGTGKELPALAPVGGPVDMMATSADGRWAVTRGMNDLFLVVWDLTEGKATGRLEVGERPWHFRFVGNDAIVVGAVTIRAPAPWTATLARWDVVKRTRTWQIDTPVDGSWMAASPDGTRFAVSNIQHVLHLFDAATGKPVVATDAHAGHVAHVAFSAAGKTITTIGRTEARVWSAEGPPLKTVTAPEFAAAWLRPGPSPDRFVFVTFDTDKKPWVVEWDHARAAIGWRFRWDSGPVDHVIPHGTDQVVVVARDGEMVNTRTVFVYDGPTGKKLHEWPLPDQPKGTGGTGATVAVTPGGTLLQALGQKLIERRLTDGKEVGEVGVLPAEGIHGAAGPITVSPDGSLVAVADRAAVRVTDLKAGKLLIDDRAGVSLYGGRAVFSKDSKRLAVWSFWGTGVRVYDLGAGVVPKVYDGRDAKPTAVAFSPDGSRLVVGYADGTGLVWDVSAK